MLREETPSVGEYLAAYDQFYGGLEATDVARWAMRHVRDYLVTLPKSAHTFFDVLAGPSTLTDPLYDVLSWELMIAPENNPANKKRAMNQVNALVIAYQANKEQWDRQIAASVVQ